MYSNWFDFSLSGILQQLEEEIEFAIKIASD